MKNYSITRSLPLAKFFYKGTHSHPVRRTVVLIESKPSYFCGYELRDGVKVRTPGKAPVKSYTKKRIARIDEIDKRRVLRVCTPKQEQCRSTLTRQSLADLVRLGA